MQLVELLLKTKKKTKGLKESAEQTSQQDFIISAYETGDISKEEAWERIKQCTPKDELFFWDMELNSAEDLKEPSNAMDFSYTSKGRRLQ